MAIPSASIQSSLDQAVVIGGSIAGLLSARVLANHFAKVTIVERDRLPIVPAPRPGVPHARHRHGFGGLLHTLDEHWWPGLEHDLITAGAVPVDVEKDFCWLAPPDTPKPPMRSWLSCSRALVEWQIRQRVAALPQIRFSETTDVVGLIAADDGTSIAGVQVCARTSNIEHRTPEMMPASLVVDASGRHSKAPKWLTALGFSAPAETVLVNQPYTVSSCIGVLSTNDMTGWKWFSLHPDDPEEGWSVGMHQIEGGRWLVSITMNGNERPPTERAEFVACLQSLEHPLLSPLLAQMQWLTTVTGGGHATNRLRHYDQLACQPGNFIVLGDAVCVFHPGYGQGMKIAAQECLILNECLQAQRDPNGNFTGFAHYFQRQITPIIAEQWALETAEVSA